MSETISDAPAIATAKRAQALVAIRALSKYYTRGDQIIPVLVDINLDVFVGRMRVPPLWTPKRGRDAEALMEDKKVARPFDAGHLGSRRPRTPARWPGRKPVCR